MDVCVFLALEATELHTQRRLVSGACCFPAVHCDEELAGFPID